MFDLDSLTLVPARWQIVPTVPRTVDIIGIHSAEAAELPSTAEALGAYFNRHPEILNGTRKASTHLGVDVDSVGYYVPFENIAYAAGGINQNGIHIEHAGYARQTRAEWLDDYSEKMLRLSASLTASLCVRYNIPVMWLAPQDLLEKRRGITSHVNACIAFGGDHWDPGYEFPEDLYIQWVRESIGDDEMTPEQFASMLGATASVREGIVGLDLKKEDGSPDGWWPLADVWEFTHRHIKSIDEST
jgi:hypothetical protein